MKRQEYKWKDFDEIFNRGRTKIRYISHEDIKLADNKLFSKSISSDQSFSTLRLIIVILHSTFDLSLIIWSNALAEDAPWC
ncbi:hypothetical protein KCU81_g409, partial [Aureobasidium melanogenum]